MSEAITATTVGAALDGTEARLAAAGCVSADAEARWLLEEVLELPAGGAAASRPRPLPPEAARALEAMVARRVAGEPLQYLIGWAPFGALRIQVGPGVFVPRPETELVAYRAATHLREAASPATAVDLCTGSGAIACFLAEAVPGSRVLATELDAAALVWARRNLDGRAVELLEGDLDEPLPDELRSGVDVLVANVPYVPRDAIPLLPHDVRVHEPRVALDGGPDGLDVLRAVVARAGRWLAPGGWLVCEIGDDQDVAAAGLLTGAGLQDVAIRPDLTGRNRMAEGRWPR
jgi:release factor glutamine methyltransferase